MIDELKKRLYFFTAWYFRFFAQIRLSRWKPRVIVVTGSSGKTTLMHFVESQLQEKAKYSHHANSSIGIPFDVLGLERRTLKFNEWPGLFITAPLKAFSAPPVQKIYVAECDCDRPIEGKFLSEFLKPEVTLWISVSRTHSENFDHLVDSGVFTTVEDAIAYEYGYFVRNTRKLVVINGDSELMKTQVKNIQTEVKQITESEYLQKYELNGQGTQFSMRGVEINFTTLQPKEIFQTIAETMELVCYLDIPPDYSFSHLQIPTGRSSVYKGVKKTILIDSSYNANLASMTVILNMFQQLTADKKWMILGDMKELGKEDREEHEKLAQLIAKMEIEKVLLLGPSINKYTYPMLRELVSEPEKVLAFSKHAELLKYVQDSIQGGETLLFKASQSLVFDGFIQHLLADQSEIHKLPRREIFWDGYRRERGL